MHPSSKTAIIDEHGKYTYGDIQVVSDHIASTLASQPSDRVAVLTHADFSFVASQIACSKANSSFIPVSIKATADEISYQLQDSQAKSMVCHVDYMEKLEKVKGIDRIRLVPITNKTIKLMLDDKRSAKVD